MPTKKPASRAAAKRPKKPGATKAVYAMESHIHPYGTPKHTDAAWQHKRFQKKSEAFSAHDREMLERAKAFGEERRGALRPTSESMDPLHHVRVANILIDEWSITDQPDIVAAGFLHDVVEDTPTTLKEIKDVFGEGVGKLVDGMTMWKGSETHEIYYRRVARGPLMLRVVKCADALDTLRSWPVMSEGGSFSVWWRQVHDLVLPMARTVSPDIAKTLEGVLDDPWYLKKAGME
ncbi:MAG: hypothetical protein RL141_606 [Candidatus Parcubacteria bacterium]|jgi:(p)ppGpp synthase/HD superfamily hydrolase